MFTTPIRPLLQQYDCLQCQIVRSHEAYGPTASSHYNNNSDDSSNSSRSPLTSRKGLASRLSLIKPSTGLTYTMYMKYGSECMSMMKAQKQPLNTTANYWISTNIGWVTKHKVLSLLQLRIQSLQSISNCGEGTMLLLHAYYDQDSITSSITYIQLTDSIAACQHAHMR
jgi:hypothetical protein